jgi:hypothetical protein
MNYLELLQQNRGDSGHAAAAGQLPKKIRRVPVLHSVKGRASLHRRATLTTGDKTTQRRKTSSMAKRRKGRKSGRLTKAEIKKAGSLKAAWAARKHTKATRKASRKAGKRRASARKSARRVARKSAKRRASRRRSAHRAPRTTVTRTVIQKLPGHTTKIAVVPVATSRSSGKRRKARRGKARRKSSKRSKAAKKGAATRKRRKSHKKKYGARSSVAKHMRAARKHGWGGGHAMENPLGGMELVVGLFTGVLGFATADLLDRFIATHALTAKSDGSFADTPPADGNYPGLYNATAVLAPMDWKRWLVGGAVSGTPLVAAQFVSSKVGRSALQMFGFGSGMRVLGKGLVDLGAMLAKKYSFTQRLYDGELRAGALKAKDGSEAALPSAGLGSPCGCANCTTGVGSCCGRLNTSSPPASPPIYAPPATPPQQPTTTPPTNTNYVPPAPPPPPPPPPANHPAEPPSPPLANMLPPGRMNAFTPTAPPVYQNQVSPLPKPAYIQGTPEQQHRSKYSWGHNDDNQ